MRDKLGRFIKGHPKPKNAYKFFKGMKLSKKHKENIGIANKGKKRSEKVKKKMSEDRKGHPSFWKGKKRPDISGKNHYRWKGRTKDSNGYIWIKQSTHPFAQKNGYLYEHRLIVESQIERYLLPSEPCHHLNGIKDDNRPQNLMTFTSEAIHQRFHKDPNSVKPSEIIFDGRTLI